MNKKLIVSTMMAMCLSSGLALAQDHGYRNDRDNSQGWEQRDQHGNEGRPQDRWNHAYDQRGAGPQHAFHRGERLPFEYRNRQYAVNNWHEHRLSAPPRGYHWVQTGRDYVLVQNSSGIILQILLGNG